MESFLFAQRGVISRVKDFLTVCKCFLEDFYAFFDLPTNVSGSKRNNPWCGRCNRRWATSLPENTLGEGGNRTSGGSLQTCASQTGGNPQIRMRGAAVGARKVTDKGGPETVPGLSDR